MDPLEQRYRETLTFLEDCVPPPARILDLGFENPLALRMRDRGYEVVSAPDDPRTDLDFEPTRVRGTEVDAITAFEVLEHLYNPFGVLREMEAPVLVATVPLRLWFANAYRNPGDPFDQHFHEFEPWQFDQLLEKTGWSITRRRKWISPGRSIGVRALLRKMTPRYYGVHAVRQQQPA